MLNFDLNSFKRQEASSESESEEENRMGLTDEVIRHHSDDEPEGYQKRYKEEGAKEGSKKESDAHRKDYGAKPNKGQTGIKIVTRKKNPEPYLYEGEEKPYVSDTEEQDAKPKKNDRDGRGDPKEKDPTYIPRGAFYQHDLRGEEETEETKRRKDYDKTSKKKWNHDKYEKEYAPKESKEKKSKGGAKKGPIIQYVAKVEGASTEAAAENNTESKSTSQQHDIPNGGSKPFKKKNEDFAEDSKNKGYQKQGKKFEYKSKEENYREGPHQQNTFASKEKEKQKDSHYSKKKGQVVVEYVPKAPEKKK